MNKESGFSLLSTIILMGIGLAVIKLMFEKQIFNKKARKAIESLGSYEVFISSFSEFTQKSIHKNLSSLCEEKSGELSALIFEGKSSGYTSKIQIPAGVNQAEQLAMRCNRPRFSSGGEIYFCMQLASNENYPKDSFAGAAYNFVELNVLMVNKWQQQISCAAYNAAESGSVGIQIRYNFFWITKTRVDHLYSRKGFYYGIKE